MSARPKWDKDIFATQMKNLRGWHAANIKSEWAALEVSAPREMKDNCGPVAAPLRLPIPAWMVGEDKTVTEAKQFEKAGDGDQEQTNAHGCSDALHGHRYYVSRLLGASSSKCNERSASTFVVRDQRALHT